MHITQISGIRLDWTMAKATDEKVEPNCMHRDRPSNQKGINIYHPSDDMGGVGQLMQKYGISANLIVGEWHASSEDGFPVIGSTLPEAVCRAIVMMLMGDVISYPLDMWPEETETLAN